MRLKTFLSVLGDIRHQTLTPQVGKIFEAHGADLFFQGGWGNQKTLSHLKSRESYLDMPKNIKIRWSGIRQCQSHTEQYGYFDSPFPKKFLPVESQIARFLFIKPLAHQMNDPVCVVFAMTGDEGFSFQKKNLSLPLIKKNIATIVVESPFYGSRKPPYQKSYLIHTVQDILTMCMAQVEEGRSLLNFLRQQGYMNLGVAGVSQGGMLAMIVGATNPFEVTIATSLGPHSPEVIFTEGLLRNFVHWKSLGLNGAGDAVEIFSDLFQMGSIYKLPFPHKKSFAIIQGAKRDLVVPRHSVQKVMDHWSFAKRHWLQGTHMSSLAFHQKEFQKLIYLSFKKSKQS